jgi:formylglycine-generating enzyme required for sulfatase activity
VTSLIATFTWTGVSVTAAGAEQESGTTANDFTGPVTYTVTADDGTTQDYMVTVTIAPPRTEKEITAYSFTAADNTELNTTVTGTITGTDIALTVPHGTDVTALVAAFTTTGVSVSVGGTGQESGTTANDFTDPVTYTVTAEDSSTQEYTVTVTIGPPAASEGSDFGSAASPGDAGTFTLAESGETFVMIYAQDQETITFPFGINDLAETTFTTKFWMGETEVTNAVMAAVLQWAYDNDKFSSTVGDSNGLDTTTAKHGGQELLDLDAADCRVDYDGSGTFSAESTFEDHPVSEVTWYGAVMICNWLTEMRDGNTDNVVYSWTDDGDGEGTASDGIWQDDETDTDTTKNGYRLPIDYEWEYTARYLGTTEPTEGDLAAERIYGNEDPDLTDGYYWTPGDYASGAIADYTNAAACQVVAVYDYQDPDPYNDEQEVKSLSANKLGIYDMNGNLNEWGFTESGSSRIWRGGSWSSGADPRLQIGYVLASAPLNSNGFLGFRLCRTAD